MAARANVSRKASRIAPALFEFEHVDVVRDGRLVLDDFSLRVGFPESVAILGPNGAGKSTLLRLIAREVYPVPNDATTCRILGRERWNVFALRSQMGIVSNDLANRIAPGTAAEDVVAGALASPDATAVREALERLGIASLARRNVFSLSSGERRRVALARALVHRPRVLVLDEPASSLDIAARRDLRAALQSLACAGVGIVLVTHDAGDVVPAIERVVFVRDGRVVADGSKRDLFAPEALEALFGVAVAVEIHDGAYAVRARR